MPNLHFLPLLPTFISPLPEPREIPPLPSRGGGPEALLMPPTPYIKPKGSLQIFALWRVRGKRHFLQRVHSSWPFQKELGSLSPTGAAPPSLPGRALLPALPASDAQCT